MQNLHYLHRLVGSRKCPVCKKRSRLITKVCSRCKYRFFGPEISLKKLDYAILATLYETVSYSETARKHSVSRQRVHLLAKKLNLIEEIQAGLLRKKSEKFYKKVLKRVKLCPECGSKFLVTPLRPAAKFCSARCFKTYRRRYTRAHVKYFYRQKNLLNS